MSAVKVPAETHELFLGKYRAVRLLGQGGMGQVFYGHDLKSHRPVVIKVMHDHLANVPAIRQSFQRELQFMMQFNHPYSVQLIDGSLDGPGRPCLVMEYIDGVSLESFAEEHGRFDPQTIGYWLGQLCQVLFAAHQSNILHRDLTLNNLMLVNPGGDNETIKVMDFGLARLTTAFFIPFEKLTGIGTNIGGGTPDYVAPEQVRGEQVDQRADLYSVGVILYRLLSGSLPFQEYTDINHILEAHKLKTAPTFEQRGIHDVPADLEAFVRQLLSKIPAERPVNAKDLALRYGQLIRQPIVPPGAFEQTPVQKQARLARYNEEFCLDLMEAWMPESIAIMKLRAFVDSVGGEIAESEPGRIRIMLPDPRKKLDPPQTQSGLLSMFRRKTLPTKSRSLHLDLFMEKKEQGTRTTVEIAVVMEPETLDTRDDAAMRAGFGQRICRELRAYLMIGR